MEFRNGRLYICHFLLYEIYKMKVDRVKFILFIMVTSTIGQMAAEIYIPSLPFIARDFQASHSLSQLSVTIYLLGMVLPTILFGYLSDFFGRRKILIVATSIGLIGNLCCVFAPSIWLFILGRFIQGVGLGGVGSLARAIMRDRLSGVELAKFASYLSMIFALVIDLSPFVGGFLQEFVGWRAIFVLLLVYNAGAVYLSTKHVDRENISLNNELDMAKLPSIIKDTLSCRTFVKYNLIAAFTYVAIMLYLAVASFIFEEKIGISPAEFGSTTLGLSFVYMFAAFLNGRLLKKYAMDTLIRNGVILMSLATLILFIMFFIGVSYWGMVLFVALMYLACGQLFSNSSASAFTSISKNIGVSSALYSTIQILLAVIFTGIVSLFSALNILPFACLMLIVCILLALLAGYKPKAPK